MEKKPAPRLGFKVKELDASGLDKGFLESLANLSDLGGLDAAEARGILDSVNKGGLPRHILVAVTSDGQVVGTTTLLVEQKFIHRGGLVGHIEDVAVRKGHEGMGLGASLVRAAVEKAREVGCYKVILDCTEEVAGFYEKFGFRRHGIEMRIDLGTTAAKEPS